MEEEVLYKVKVEGITSIENLTKANKELREERKKIDLDSEAGQARVAKINKDLDANTAKIKDNVAALEKQRLNIGNYKSALDGVSPKLSVMIQGIQGTTTASKALIATPLGLVLGALGLVIGALTAYFKGSEEGQNSFNRIMNIGSAIVGKFTDLLSFLGENVFKVLISGFETTIKFLEKWVPGFANATKAVEKFLNLDRANYISDLEAETDILERQLIVEKAKLEAKVAENKLRAEDKSLDLKTRKEALDEASKAQKELNDLETKVAENRFEIAKAVNAQSKSNKEAMDKEAEAEAALFRIRKDASDKQKEIFTKNQDLRNQEIAKLNELSNARFADEIAAVTTEQKKQEEYKKTVQELNNLIEKVEEYNQIVNLSSELAEQEKSDKEELTAANKAYEAAIKKETEATEKENAIKAVKLDTIGQLATTISLLSAVSKEAAIVGIALERAQAISQVVSNTGVANTKALAASPLTFGQPWVGINTALAGVSIGLILSQALKSTGEVLGFAQGGLTGTRIMNHHGLPINRGNGDNRLATVRTGEVILNERQQAALGGSKTFARIGVPGFAEGGFVSSTARQSESSLNSLFNAFQQVPIVVTVEDINAGVNRVGSVTNRARVI